MANQQNHDQGQRNIGEGAPQGPKPKKPPQHEQQDQGKQYQPGHGKREPDQGQHPDANDRNRQGGQS